MAIRVFSWAAGVCRDFAGLRHGLFAGLRRASFALRRGLFALLLLTAVSCGGGGGGIDLTQNAPSDGVPQNTGNDNADGGSPSDDDAGSDDAGENDNAGNGDARGNAHQEGHIEPIPAGPGRCPFTNRQVADLNECWETKTCRNGEVVFKYEACLKYCEGVGWVNQDQGHCHDEPFVEAVDAIPEVLARDAVPAMDEIPDDPNTPHINEFVAATPFIPALVGMPGIPGILESGDPDPEVVESQQINKVCPGDSPIAGRIVPKGVSCYTTEICDSGAIRPHGTPSCDFWYHSMFTIFQLERINTNAAHLAGWAGQSVTVAIIGSGVQAEHRDLRTNIADGGAGFTATPECAGLDTENEACDVRRITSERIGYEIATLAMGDTEPAAEGGIVVTTQFLYGRPSVHRGSGVFNITGTVTVVYTPTITVMSETHRSVYRDLNGHGTAIAGIIAGRPFRLPLHWESFIPQDGTAGSSVYRGIPHGIAPRTKLLPIKVADGGFADEQHEIDEIVKAAVGHAVTATVQIINNGYQTEVNRGKVQGQYVSVTVHYERANRTLFIRRNFLTGPNIGLPCNECSPDATVIITGGITTITTRTTMSVSAYLPPQVRKDFSDPDWRTNERTMAREMADLIRGRDVLMVWGTGDDGWNPDKGRIHMCNEEAGMGNRNANNIHECNESDDTVNNVISVDYEEFLRGFRFGMITATVEATTVSVGSLVTATVIVELPPYTGPVVSISIDDSLATVTTTVQVTNEIKYERRIITVSGFDTTVTLTPVIRQTLTIFSNRNTTTTTGGNTITITAGVNTATITRGGVPVTTTLATIAAVTSTITLSVRTYNPDGSVREDGDGNPVLALVEKLTVTGIPTTMMITITTETPDTVSFSRSAPSREALWPIWMLSNNDASAASVLFEREENGKTHYENLARDNADFKDMADRWLAVAALARNDIVADGGATAVINTTIINTTTIIPTTTTVATDIRTTGFIKEPSLAEFSNGCGAAKWWCISAPGEYIFTYSNSGAIDHGLTMFAGGDVPFGLRQLTSFVNPNTGNNVWRSGTSMAGAIVSGSAAVLRSAFPMLPMPVIRGILLSSATPLGTAREDVEYADQGGEIRDRSGIDQSARMVDDNFGWGELNLGAAVRFASSVSVYLGGVSPLASAQSAPVLLSGARIDLPAALAHIRPQFSDAKIAAQFGEGGAYFNVPLASMAFAAAPAASAALGDAAADMLRPLEERREDGIFFAARDNKTGQIRYAGADLSSAALGDWSVRSDFCDDCEESVWRDFGAFSDSGVFSKTQDGVIAPFFARNEKYISLEMKGEGARPFAAFGETNGVPYEQYGLRLRKNFSRFGAEIEARQIRESDGFLGANFGAFGKTSAATNEGKIAFRGALSENMRGFAEYRRAHGNVKTSGALSAVDGLRAEGWSAGLEWGNVFSGGDRLRFTARQRMSITGGRATMRYTEADGDFTQSFYENIEDAPDFLKGDGAPQNLHNRALTIDLAEELAPSIALGYAARLETGEISIGAEYANNGEGAVSAQFQIDW